MIKRFLLILICVALFCSCDKQDSSEGGSDIFESQMVNLSSDKQIIDIKASETHWYMRVKEVEESMNQQLDTICLLYTSPSPRDAEESRMPSSA